MSDLIFLSASEYSQSFYCPALHIAINIWENNQVCISDVSSDIQPGFNWILYNVIDGDINWNVISNQFNRDIIYYKINLIIAHNKHNIQQYYQRASKLILFV